MEHDSLAPRSSWAIDLRWLMAGSLALLLAWLVWRFFGPDPPLIVSPRTTVITAPLAADGLPDYEAAAARAEVSADENVVAGLLQAAWPLGLAGENLKRGAEAVGIEPAAPGGAVLRRPDERDALRFAARFAWREADLPRLAEWCCDNDAALDAVAAAIDRPCWRMPPAHCWPPYALEAYGEVEAVGLALAIRGNGRVAGGRYAAAWSDAAAILRLARLIAASAADDPIGALIVEPLANRAADTTLQLVARADLPPAVLDEMRAAWRDDIPRVPRGEGMTAYRRLVVAGIVAAAIGRSMPVPLPSRSELAGPLPAAASLDWNAVLVDVNDYFDAVSAAVAHPSHAVRRAELSRVMRDFNAREAGPASLREQLGRLLGLALDARARGRRAADRIVNGDRGLIYGSSRWSDIDDDITDGEARASLARTAVALRAHRDAHGSFPERLDSLVPGFLENVPADPFSAGPLRYTRRGDGYLLWSVGRDGGDDGGTCGETSGPGLGTHWLIEHGEWVRHDEMEGSNLDVAIRLPFPDARP